MSLRRYAIFYAPIEHMNGKYDKASRKCSWQPDTDTNGVAYYYGYRHNKHSVSRYAYRDKCRNLSLHPVTTSEQANLSLFRRSVQVAKDVYPYIIEGTEAFRQFKTQRQYVSKWGWSVAITYKNGGIFPYLPPIP